MFMYFRNPNVGDKNQWLVKWPMYKSNKGQKYLELNLKDFEVGRGPIIPECMIWDKYI